MQKEEDMNAVVVTLADGVLIGSSIVLLMLANGRIAGISGVVGGLFGSGAGEVGWRLAFVGGLIAGPFAATLFVAPLPEIDIDAPPTVVKARVAARDRGDKRASPQTPYAVQRCEPKPPARHRDCSVAESAEMKFAEQLLDRAVRVCGKARFNVGVAAEDARTPITMPSDVRSNLSLLQRRMALSAGL